MGLVEVGAGRAFALDQVGHGIEAHAVDAAIEPEMHDLRDRLEHRRVVEVQVRLVMEEAMPVVGAGGVVPRPVRLLRIGEDDRDALVLLVGVAPDVEVAHRRSRRRLPRRLEPRMLVGGVVDDQLGDDAQPAGVRLLDEAVEVLERTVGGVDVPVVGDVVAVVPQRRRVEGLQPDRVDAERLHVVEPLGEAAEIADPVLVRVQERAHVRLVDDRVLEPEGVAGHQAAFRRLVRSSAVRR